ncbi:hypothetical protein MTR67_002785 [Solanum verrucosum]|uniref:DUF4218 domain-containing protein n=1 Tax=Solanum verrucosum TaxID=315347 RepID=A0AAF0TDM4_SOLVR|nr:hypothetical protein MTR67_002785 [Solanum verrucosum]
MLIPGPNGPGDAIDAYLQPLIEELKELWEVGKTKDTINTRLDLKEMNIRPELYPIQRGEKVEVSTAYYTLSPEDKHKLCLFLKNLKVPDGFSSNISQCVNLKDHKISGLKSHDCHVLLQHILPLALRGEAEIAGSIHYRWMHPIERWLYFLKSLIGNRACPEGSIAEGYIANECMTLCSRFDMKTENEDGSIMKSTIRYSFVAPGAIGRGRGRGLKSLTSKGKFSTKSSLLQSSDLVKKYIQEVETSKLLNVILRRDDVPMFSSHEKRAINEKSNMSLEKEYMQGNTSFHPSTKQSKKYIHDVETIKDCQLDKNTPVLEKENTQAKSPNSIDQVMQPSQTTETGSSNPRKVKRVRGSNKCKEVASLEAGKRLKDKFESVDLNDHRDHIFGWMNELWNKWRGYLHATYVKNKPIVQALKNIPKGVEKKEWEWLVKEHFCFESFQGGKDGNPSNLATIFFETRKKDSMLVEPEAIEKHAQIEEILKVVPSLPSIEIVGKCYEYQTHSHVFGISGGVKAKDMRGGTSSKTELLSQLRSTQEENKSLNEKNKSLNDRLSTLEDEMKEIRKMQEFFAAQQSHNPHMTSPVSTE